MCQFLCAWFAARTYHNNPDNFEIIVLGEIREGVMEGDHEPVLIRDRCHFFLRPLVEVLDFGNVVVRTGAVVRLIVRVDFGQTFVDVLHVVNSENRAQPEVRIAVFIVVIMIVMIIVVMMVIGVIVIVVMIVSMVIVVVMVICVVIVVMIVISMVIIVVMIISVVIVVVMVIGVVIIVVMIVGMIVTVMIISVVIVVVMVISVVIVVMMVISMVIVVVMVICVVIVVMMVISMVIVMVMIVVISMVVMAIGLNAFVLEPISQFEDRRIDATSRLDQVIEELFQPQSVDEDHVCISDHLGIAR